MKIIKLATALSILILTIFSLTGCASSAWPGAWDIYKNEMDIAYEDAAPGADRAAMDRAKQKLIDAKNSGDLASARAHVTELRCAAKLGSAGYRADACK